MRFDLLARYRPTRTTDGRHGFNVSYGTAVNLWAVIQPHANVLTISFRAGEDVKVEDVIIAASGCYRVTDIMGHVGGPVQRGAVERIQRPIFPDDTPCSGSGSDND